eukprot:PhF_6_TR13194/c0_g1_i1/m.20838/K00823/puuE; 4-aminobutyrate aminotransferase
MSYLTAEYAASKIAKGVSTPMVNAVVEKAQGSWIWDTTGRKLLDLTTGIGVCSLGHCHPAVTSAASAQLNSIVHCQVNVVYQKPMLELIHRMSKHLPQGKLDTFFFWNSGAEAVEAAMKLSRHATGRSGVICMQGSFHGRTFGTMSITTSKNVYHTGLHPLLPAVHVTPFPMVQQMHVPADTPTDELVARATAFLEDILHQSTSPKDIGMIIMEPVLGEGGYLPAPYGYVDAVRKVCDKYGILLAFDEVQSGVGRTGTLFAYEHYTPIVPDILVFAKGIANGLPLSGIVSRKEIMDKQPPGTMGGTYAGNAVACAAACAVLETFEKENILQNVNARSKELREGLLRIATEVETIKEVRGAGLMIGIHLDDTKAGIAKSLTTQCLKNGMMLLATSKYEAVRFIPPLNVTKDEISLALEIFEKSLKEVSVPLRGGGSALKQCCPSPCLKCSDSACRYYSK